MKETWAKSLVRRVCFPNGSVRKIRFGPLAGRIYKVSPITGMSAWYSGPERSHHDAFRRIVRDGDTVIDVGANWGVHTLFLSTRVGATGRVIAVEPLPQAVEELQWHLDVNNCSNVTLCQCALSDKSGEASFVETDSAYTGHLASMGAQGKREHCVRTLTLDGLVEEQDIDTLRLVKMDVEGAESAVLGGARTVLDRLRPTLIIDLHTPEQDVAVARLLTSAGYSLQRLDGTPISRTDVGWPALDGVWGSIIAEPK